MSEWCQSGQTINENHQKSFCTWFHGDLNSSHMINWSIWSFISIHHQLFKYLFNKSLGICYLCHHIQVYVCLPAHKNICIWAWVCKSVSMWFLVCMYIHVCDYMCVCDKYWIELDWIRFGMILIFTAYIRRMVNWFLSWRP